MLKEGLNEKNQLKILNSNLNSRITDLNEKEKTNKISQENFEIKLNLIIAENTKLNNVIEINRREKESFNEIELKIERLLQENDKLAKILFEKNNEVEYWKKRYFENV